MYISNIQISNFRNFIDTSVIFTPGLNVIIGHNNAGKTNVLRALQFVFAREQRNRPTIDDFNKTYDDFSSPPRIDIRVTITEHPDAEKPDDKNVIYDWLINEGPPYEAQLTYTFFLPSKHLEEYKEVIEEHKDAEGNYIQKDCFSVIGKRFINKYVSQIFGGDPKREERAESENLDRFDFQFLDAIRDAERQMFYGNNTLLRDVLRYFLDYDVSNGKQFEELDDATKSILRDREREFSEKSEALLQHLIDRISKEKILEYSQETGADKGGKPDFDATISEHEILFALRLIVEQSGFTFPITHNGLGYNNLLFIALILAKMQMQRSGFMGDNAKVFPILAIEEPEAHLHPSMQYKFLQFLDNNLKKQEQARQLFITSHSTHITAAVDLDAVICLYEDIEGKQQVGYPGKVFTDTPEDVNSKNYVKRFLDATKSNMLFAERVILVEGLAEQVLLPCLASYLSKEEDLLNKHVCIVSVDSRTFDHFLKLFTYNKDSKRFAINKKVACITDTDPCRKDKPPPGSDVNEHGKKVRWHSCYPFELDQDTEAYEYKSMAKHVGILQSTVESSQNISIYSSPAGVGMTLEYDLIFNNPNCLSLITDSFPSRGKNRKEVMISLVDAHKQIKSLTEIKALSNHSEIIDSLEGCLWEDDRKKKALIAAVYSQALKKRKGEHALYLEQQLRDNLEKGEDREAFVVPEYISDAITFILS